MFARASNLCWAPLPGWGRGGGAGALFLEVNKGPAGRSKSPSLVRPLVFRISPLFFPLSFGSNPFS